MLQTIVRFLKDERSGVTFTPNLLFTATGAGLGFLAAHGLHHHLSHLAQGVTPGGLGSLDPGAAGVGAAVGIGALTAGATNDKNNKIVTARNIARSPVLPGRSNTEKCTQPVRVQEPLSPTQHYEHISDDAAGYRIPSGGAVYVPRQPLGQLAELPFMPLDLVKAFQELPAEAQPILAALCTLFLEQADDITRKYHEKNPGMTHGAVKTTLRQLAKKIGLSDSGKNLRMLAEVLGVMVFTHAADFVVGYKSKNQKAEEIRMAVGRFITWIEYRWRKDDPFRNVTVGITICPALTDFLLSPECREQMIWVSVEALKKLRQKRRRSRYSIPLFFFLIAANPGQGKAFLIGWEKAAEKAGIPNKTKSGRPVRPNEKKKIIREIMQDINDTSIIRITEKEDMYTITFPKKVRKQKRLPTNTSNGNI